MSRFTAVSDRHREWLRYVEGVTSAEVVECRDGGVTVPLADGTFLHSRYNPQREAEKFVDRFYRPDAGAFVLLGVGLGYSLLELQRRSHDLQTIFALELNTPVLRAGMEHLDWSPVLESSRTVVSTGTDVAHIRQSIKNFLHTQYVSEIVILELPSARRIWVGAFEAVRDLIAHEVSVWQTELNTLRMTGRAFDRNVIRNIPNFVGSPSLVSKEGAWSGRPAVIVGAGPGLEDHLDVLREKQEALAVFAVGKAAKPLREAGIRVDLVFHTDPHESGVGVYAEEDFEFPVVYDFDANPDAIRRFTGERYGVYAEDMTPPLYRECLGERPVLLKGLSVAHSAFSMARFLGADPVYLVGVDFAFRGEQSHAGGTVKTWALTPEQIENHPNVRDVPSVAGETVRTTLNMRSFGLYFQGMIERLGGEVVNCSTFGMAIPGTRIGRLDEVATGPRDGGVNLDVESAGDHDWRRLVDTLEESFQTLASFASEGLEAIENVALMGKAKVEDVINHCRARMIECEDQISFFVRRALVSVYVEITDLRFEQIRTDSRSVQSELHITRRFFEGYREIAEAFLEDVRDVREELAAGKTP
jgi:hypothetical protein